MNWSLFPTISAPMSLQMAFDELLFASQKMGIQAPALRFYIASSPWISVGCSFRKREKQAASELILKNPEVPITQRVTGGGCVFHGRDLIFSLVARIQSDPERLGSVRASYVKLHEGVRLGLRLCGLDPKFYSNEVELPKGQDCFSFPVESDLSYKGRKIAGGAQKRSEGVLLHHESITMPEGVERDVMIQAVRKGFEQVFNVSIQNADLDPTLYFEAERVAKDRRFSIGDKA